ncbi:hypothetical protein R1flu_002364 [Riccia fluitans]|uniref:protein-tyrosine-phosphatase n=1 Tax=Riccia fluitans TaxID=41844 RepID=A0ABD1Y9R3_9MARC
MNELCTSSTPISNFGLPSADRTRWANAQSSDILGIWTWRRHFHRVHGPAFGRRQMEMSNSPITPTPSTRFFMPKLNKLNVAGFNLLEALSTPVKPVALSADQLELCKNAVRQMREKLQSRGSRSQIDKEFDSLMTDRSSSHLLNLKTNAALYVNNIGKNRYANVLPYDDNRVTLTNNYSGDYINASFITGQGLEDLPVYIATQGPLRTTMNDFWEMVLQERCPVIIMLTVLMDGSQDKCYSYFPSVLNQPEQYGRLCVTTKFEDNVWHNSVVKRVFEIRNLSEPGATPHNVLHLEYLDWPDFGAPASTGPVRDMIRTLQFIPVNAGPFVVHCSAGIGRTGTYCAIDHTLRRIINGDLTAVEIWQSINNFRGQRYGMVQTRDQLRFCYEAVCDELEDLIASNQMQSDHKVKSQHRLSGP